MRCISPLTIRVKGGFNTVPCSKCNFCLQTKRAEWSFRLSQETKVSSTANFLTLTYEDHNLPLNSVTSIPELRKRDYQLFTKRLRKEQSQISEETIRYYAVGEYGTKTQRPHYHAIMFNLRPEVRNQLVDIWSHGFVDIGDVTPASIHYVTKYVINRYDENKGREPPFSLMSRKPALGRNYLDTHTDWHRQGQKDYTQVGGHIGRLPRYYRDKIFSKFEREMLQIQNITEADEQYIKAVSKLSRYKEDADSYYYERISHQHEQLKNKVNKLNKF